MKKFPESEETICACGALSGMIPSLTTMRPDPYWAGVLDRDYGYITSATQLKREMKTRRHVEIGSRRDVEWFERKAEEAQRDKKTKLNKDIRRWTEKTFGSEGLGLGGADGEKLLKENS